MNMTDLKPDETGIITDITLDGALRHRLCDMGVDLGASVKMLRSAPLGDPIEFHVLGYRLCIRKKEAAKIFIERTGVSGG